MVKQIIISGIEKWTWPQRYRYRDDFTTSAPQKLWRLITDTFTDQGYRNFIQNDEPTIKGMAIGDSGTTKGHILVENTPKETDNPWFYLGIILIIMGVISFPIIFFYVGVGGGDVINAGSICGGIGIGITLIFIGIKLLKKRYVSNLIQLKITGEVYASSARLSSHKTDGRASAARKSIISDIRLEMYAISIISQDTNDGRKIIEFKIKTIQLDNDYKSILKNIKNNIRPALELDSVDEKSRIRKKEKKPQHSQNMVNTTKQSFTKD